MRPKPRARATSQRLSSIAPKCFQQETDLRGISSAVAFLCCFSPTASRVFPNSHGFPPASRAFPVLESALSSVFGFCAENASSTLVWQWRRGAEARKMPVGARFGRKCHLVAALAASPLTKAGSNWHFLPLFQKTGAHEQKRAAYRSQGVEKRANSAKKAAELLTLARSSPPVISKARQPNWERGATCEAALEPLCNEPFPCGSSGQENASRCRQNGRKASPR